MRDRHKRKRGAISNLSHSYISNSRNHHNRSGYTYSTAKGGGGEHGKRQSNSSWTDESSSAYRSSLTTNYYDKQTHRSGFWRFFLNQRFYYITGLFVNALLLSFYTVMAFVPHIPCLTPTGANVTKGFEFAFKLGFFALAADFANSAFFEFYVRTRNQFEQEKKGFVSAATLTLETVYAVMEWVFRGLICLVSLLQVLIRTSATGKYCIEETQVLEEEGAWLKWLIIIQCTKVLLFSAWHITLNHKKQSFFDDQYDTTFFDQTTMMDDTKLNGSVQRRLAASSRLHRKRQEEDSYYDDDERNNGMDEESGRLLYRDDAEEDDITHDETPDSQGTRHRVKFATANYAAYEHQAKRKKPKAKFMQRGAPQRNTTADYDVEDMDGVQHSSSEEDSQTSSSDQQPVRQQQKRPKRQQRQQSSSSPDDDETSGHEGADQTLQSSRMSHGTVEQDITQSQHHQSMFMNSRAGPNQSRFGRQKSINNRYLLADPTQALDSTNMNVFKERSMMSSSFAPLTHISYLASTKSTVKRKRRNKDNK